MGGGGVLGVFVLVQDLAGAGDDFGGKAGEFGDFDAVAFVGGAGCDLAQEDDAAGALLDADVDSF